MITFKLYTQAERDADAEIAAASDAVVNYLIETAPAVYQRLVDAFTAREKLGKAAEAATTAEGQA